MLKNKRDIFVIISIITCSILSSYILYKSFAIKNNNISIEEERLRYIKNYEYNITNKQTFLCEYINNRMTVIKEKDILIGENKKELENGYFDVKISANEKSSIMYINKLFIDNSIKESNVSFDNEYLRNVVDLWIQAFKFDIDEDGKNKLINIIKQEYLILRDISVVYDVSEDKYLEERINSFVVKFSILDNMLCIVINF